MSPPDTMLRSIDTLYLGQAVIDTKTLNRSGTAPVAPQAVNGSTHTLYSSSDDGVLLPTRAG